MSAGNQSLIDKFGSLVYTGSTGGPATEVAHFRILMIDRIVPERPIEYQEIEVFFSITNYSLSPISGIVRPTLGGQEVPITDLGPKATFTGSVRTKAPAARNWAVPVELQFVMPPPPGTELFEIIDTRGSGDVIVVASYVVRIDQFEIFETRSVIDDTDYVGLHVAVDDPEQINQPPLNIPMQWKAMGDVGGGVHLVPNLAVGPFNVLPSTKIAINYQIHNYGHDAEAVEKFLNKLSDSSEQALELIFPGSVWDAANDFTKYLNSLIFANCDGPCALDFIQISGGDVNELTVQTGVYSETREYPGPNVGPEGVKVYESADGCGASPHYKVTYSYQRTSFQAG